MTCWSVLAYIITLFFCITHIQGREFIFCDLEKNMFMIDLDAWKWISFKLGMLIDITKLYIFILVSVTWTFNKGSRILRKLELVHPLCC